MAKGSRSPLGSLSEPDQEPPVLEVDHIEQHDRPEPADDLLYCVLNVASYKLHGFDAQGVGGHGAVE